MHVHCLSVLMLVLTAQTFWDSLCSLFYLNINIWIIFFFNLCYQIMFPIVENIFTSVNLSCVPLDIFVQKGSLIFYFYTIFVVFSSDCSLNFHSPELSCRHFQSSCLLSQTQRQIWLPVRRKGKYSHNRCASAWRKISHRIAGHKILLLKGTY